MAKEGEGQWLDDRRVTVRVPGSRLGAWLCSMCWRSPSQQPLGGLPLNYRVNAMVLSGEVS